MSGVGLLLDIDSECTGAAAGSTLMAEINVPGIPMYTAKRQGQVGDTPPARKDLEYVQQDGVNLVRADAVNKAPAVNNDLEKVFSYFGFSVQDTKAMQIDHATPCAEVHERVKILLTLLNRYKNFADGFMKIRHSQHVKITMDKYFVKSNNKWFARLYLYVCLYNNILNTGLMPHVDNAKKSDTEFLIYIKKHHPYLYLIFDAWLEKQGHKLFDGVVGIFVAGIHSIFNFIEDDNITTGRMYLHQDVVHWQPLLTSFVQSLNDYFTASTSKGILQVYALTSYKIRESILKFMGTDRGANGESIQKFLARILPVMQSSVGALIEDAASRALGMRSAEEQTPPALLTATQENNCAEAMESMARINTLKEIGKCLCADVRTNIYISYFITCINSNFFNNISKEYLTLILNKIKERMADIGNMSSKEFGIFLIKEIENAKKMQQECEQLALANEMQRLREELCCQSPGAATAAGDECDMPPSVTDMSQSSLSSQDKPTLLRFSSQADAEEEEEIVQSQKRTHHCRSSSSLSM